MRPSDDGGQVPATRMRFSQSRKQESIKEKKEKKTETRPAAALRTGRLTLLTCRPVIKGGEEDQVCSIPRVREIGDLGHFAPNNCPPQEKKKRRKKAGKRKNLVVDGGKYMASNLQSTTSRAGRFAFPSAPFTPSFFPGPAPQIPTMNHTLYCRYRANGGMVMYPRIILVFFCLARTKDGRMGRIAFLGGCCLHCSSHSEICVTRTDDGTREHLEGIQTHSHSLARMDSRLAAREGSRRDPNARSVM
ncbi:hypothetical protein B0T19DRAFT_247562 [Cercophora scortea]|uniref:Uncharacterized protein n=1 Tax=Cercophora scortea TaxID=314031 RepID=A0AAE0M617_9PEZI|nr:hypothetical protein B0T19DRAFT_247562 [Cercophora scortea]